MGFSSTASHDHAVHWTSTTSLTSLDCRPGIIQVRLALVMTRTTQELPGASTISNFNVQQPPTRRTPAPTSPQRCQFPRGALVSTGRPHLSIANDLTQERSASSTRHGYWTRAPFCPIPISGSTSGEQGLLGSHAGSKLFVVQRGWRTLYDTTPGGTGNRVSRFRKSGGVCTETIILDITQANDIHNGRNYSVRAGWQVVRGH